ncbi:MAG: flagellar hook-associated protein FlgK [Planctomycetes bacterium]|nr:flagellar hook-associated protein FlgK [Planctomycetota bacterium]
MGLLNSALQIGRSAILGYQGALQVVGNNVSSAASPDYTRLTPGLDPLPGPFIGRDLQPGAGVALTSIQRNIDEALESRIRLAIGATASTTQQQLALNRVEAFFNTVNETDIASRMSAFFHSFDEVQNLPEDTATRELAITSGAQLATALHDMREQFALLGADLDGQIGDLVSQANDLAQRIGKLNEEITTAEAGRQGQATGLRDQRDALLRELSDIVDVTVRVQPNGAINVYAGSEALIQGNFVRQLATATASDGEFTRTSVRFADTNGQVDLGGGRIAGLIAARDRHAFGQIAAIDELAAGIITEVNRVHADGQGLRGMASVTGANDLLVTDTALNSSAAGLADTPQSGSFYVTVFDDATQTPTAYRIDVDFSDPATATTLESLVAAFNGQVQGVTASITSDRRIAFAADPGRSFVFGFDGQQARTDTSHVLAALGVNTFFTGTSAKDMAVNEVLAADPLLLAAAATFHPGDGVIAGRLAALDSTPAASMNGLSLSETYDSIANAVAVTAGAANDAAQAASTVQTALQTQKESLSGVNLDEEAIALVKYERAFQGAARFVSVVDGLLNDLVTLIR